MGGSTRKSSHLNKKESRFFPGGLVVKSLAANAGDTGSIPTGQGTEIPHTAERLSLRTWSLGLGQERPPRRGSHTAPTQAAVTAQCSHSR